jgi:hypothetical protein
MKKIIHSIQLKTKMFLLMISICCWIPASLGAYCDSNATDSDDTRITNVSIHTLDVSSPNNCAVYTDYTEHSTDLVAGETYSISVSQGTCFGFFPAYLTVYIDFYQNGEFAQADEVFSFGYTNQLGPISGFITVPSDAVPGSTRMRVILSEDGPEPPCGSYDYGETQDFSVNIIDTPCTNPPVPGSATSSRSEVCSGDNFLLNLSGHSTGTGQTYQWQSSTDGMEWNDIDNAINASVIVTQQEETWYRAMVTCGAAEISEAVKVEMLPSMECYCTSSAADGVDSKISNVTLHTLDVSSPNSCEVYTDYTDHSTDLEAGETYTISVSQGTCLDFYEAWITVYIDFYQNDQFTEADEVFRYGPTSQLGPVNGTITVPSDAVTGPTRMRVILSEDGPETPCSIYSYGETQDFTVNIERSTNTTTPQESAHSFTIFPNHASDRCTVSLRSPYTSDFHLAVYDIMGRVVYSHSGISDRELLHEIDLSSWPVGQYIVNMNIDGKQLSRKLIVNR